MAIPLIECRHEPDAAGKAYHAEAVISQYRRDQVHIMEADGIEALGHRQRRTDVQQLATIELVVVLAGSVQCVA